jgi:O-antigen/teichoic acid export membrane protein
MTVTTRKVTAGFGWVALCNYSNRILGFVTTLILAKVLTPSDFGVVAIASMMIQVIQILKDMGLSEAVIYNKREDRSAIDTAHTVLVGYNTILFLIAAAIAPFAARFYDNPTVLPVILVMSSSLVINSMRSVPLSLFRKRLQYAKLVLPDIVPVAVSSGISIVMALTGFGVWSLVAKTLLHSLLALVLLQFIIPDKPRFAFDRSAARELFQYGRFIVGTTVLAVVLYNIDKFYISKFGGLAALGIYVLALNLAELPVKQFSFLVGNVMFPVYSRLEGSGRTLRTVFLKTLKYTSSVTLPMAVGLSLFGPPLVGHFFGSRWDGLGAPLRVLALYAAFRSISSITHDLFKATGNANLMQRAFAFRLAAVALLGIPAVYMHGLVGIAILLVLTYAATLCWEMQRLRTILNTSLATLFDAVARPLVLSVTVLPATYALMLKVTGLTTLWEVVLAMAIAGAAYLFGLYLLDKEAVLDLKAFRANLRAPETYPQPTVQ